MREISIEREGLRARKKRETMERIAQTGLKLFLENGYAATTLDEIAEKAGIARRTFFYYFKSKEEILIAYLEEGFGQGFRCFLAAHSHESSPLAAVRASLIEMFCSHDEQNALEIYNLFESSEALKSRMLASSIRMEESVFAALRELWPEPSMRDSLRMVAVVSTGALRLAKDAWRQDGGTRPLAEYLEENFAALEK